MIGPSDVDYYRFSAAEGQYIKLKFDVAAKSTAWTALLYGLTPRSRTNLDAEAAIWAPGGAVLANYTNDAGLLEQIADAKRLPASVRGRARLGPPPGRPACRPVLAAEQRVPADAAGQRPTTHPAGSRLRPYRRATTT